MGNDLARAYAEYEKRGEEITKTYKAPKVSYRTPLQMLKLLVRSTLSPACSLFTLVQYCLQIKTNIIQGRDREDYHQGGDRSRQGT